MSRIKPITYYPEVVQGSPEWLEVRRGMLTASEMHLIVTPTLKAASNDKERGHLYELMAQRISGYVEPAYISYDMLRGKDEEIRARQTYAEHYAPVTDMGFIVNRRHGVAIGFSPDGLVAKNGFIEVKSKRQGLQVKAIVECVAEKTIPAEHMLQAQTGLLVSERKWCDFISFSGGLPVAVVRVFPDPIIQEAIVTVAQAFEARLAEKMATYFDLTKTMIPTERVTAEEMYLGEAA